MLEVSLTLEQGGPFSSEDSSSEETASSDSVVAPCCVTPGGRASPADITTSVALVTALALGQEGPFSSQDSASSDLDPAVPLHSTNPRGLASPTDLTTSVSRALIMRPALDQENPASPGNTAHAERGNEERGNEERGNEGSRHRVRQSGKGLLSHQHWLSLQSITQRQTHPLFQSDRRCSFLYPNDLTQHE